MKIRECLKELSGKYNLLNEEYKELISFKKLASNKKLLEKLLREKSPEAIKVACLSGKGYGVALKDIQSLYMGDCEASIGELMKKYSDAKDFEKEILSKVDINIINKLAGYFWVLEQKKCELQNQQQNLDNELSDIDKISADIAVIDKCVVPYKSHRKAIKQWQAKVESDENLKIRCQNLLNIYRNTPGGVLDDFIDSSSTLSDKQKKLIRKTVFLKKLLEEISIYGKQGIAILLELWKQNLIKLENREILIYLCQYIQQVNDFIKERIQSDSIDIEYSFLELLLQALIEKERDNLATGEVNRDIDVWNEFIDEEQWQCVLSKIRQVISSDEMSQMLSLILRK